METREVGWVRRSTCQLSGRFVDEGGLSSGPELPLRTPFKLSSYTLSGNEGCVFCDVREV